MTVKLIKTKDFYPTMMEWWDGQEKAHVSPSMLPENTFVCFNDEDVPTYSMCFYNTDSHLCWLGWQIANPRLTREQKRGCFPFLFKAMEDYAKASGYHLMFTTSNTPAVEGTLSNLGYEMGDKNVNHYIKIIQ